MATRAGMNNKTNGQTDDQAEGIRTLSVRTLELCDFLVNGMTLAANADNFEDWAERISTARKEIQKMLMDDGRQPILNTSDGPVGGLYSDK